MIKVHLLQYGKLGQWSLSKDLSNAKFFFEKNDCKINSSILNADVIFSAWYNVLLDFKYYYIIRLLKKIRKIKIISVISHDVKENKKFLKHANILFDIVDVWIVPSRKALSHLQSLNSNIKTVLIPFFVSGNIFFKLDRTRESLAKELGVDYELIENKILLGSFQRDSLGKNLLSPRWQKNPELLVNICKTLPKDKILLVLAGPRRHYIIKECRKYNIPYLFIGNEELIDKNKDDLKENNLSEEKINLLYNLIDLYLVSSVSEGGPKSILESSLCKTLILSTDVGFAKDFLHPDLIFSEKNTTIINRVISFLEENPLKIKEYIEYNHETTSQVVNDQNYIKLYNELLK